MCILWLITHSDTYDATQSLTWIRTTLSSSPFLPRRFSTILYDSLCISLLLLRISLLHLCNSLRISHLLLCILLVILLLERLIKPQTLSPMASLIKPGYSPAFLPATVIALAIFPTIVVHTWYCKLNTWHNLCVLKSVLVWLSFDDAVSS